MSIVFTTEKNSVAKEYLKVLQIRSENKGGFYEGFSPVMNDNVIITWAVGHLIQICNPKKQDKKWDCKWRELPMPIIPKEIKYEVIPDVKDQYEVIKATYLRSDIETIYYAGDSGREGIYIQALIRNTIFNNKTPKCNEKVVWIDSFTEASILKGIDDAKPYSDYIPMVESGYARAIDDWLIGMNFTVGFTLTTGAMANTGRVMTPTLAMIVKRQEEIDKFVKTDFYGISADLAKGSTVMWKAVEGTRFFDNPKFLYNENGFNNREYAEKLIAAFNRDMHLTVNDVKSEQKKEFAKLPFNLADLQSYCSSAFHISPADTLAIAQHLYEQKYTTYPRTEAPYLSTAVQKDYKQRFGFDIPDRYVNDKAIKDHYAIIPTFEGTVTGLNDLQQKVYDAILKCFNDMMKPPYVYDAISVTYKHQIGELFFEAFRKVKDYGWKKGEKDDEAVDKPVPKKGEVVDVTVYSVREMETKPPVSYTTGSLIKAMERAGRLIDDDELRKMINASGIGTAATRANIIEKLVEKEFITVNKAQKITPTELGKKLIPIIVAFDEMLVSPIKTADMEQKLNSIADGTLDRETFIKEVEEYVSSTTDNILKNQKTRLASPSGGGDGNSPTYVCPKCGGSVVNGKFGWYCTAKCGMYFNKVYGHELTENQVESLLSGKEITYTDKGRKTTVVPKVKESTYQGKTYYNWDTKGAAK